MSKDSKESKSSASSSGLAAGSAALEGFEALVKSAQGQACVMIIQQVLKHPSIFVFGELLDAPNVKDLANKPDHRPSLELLKLFAYGTYTDYKAKAEKENLPKLGTKELTKLKQLSIVEAAAKNKLLMYESLLNDLEMGSLRELEDMIIDCVYLGLIQGKLDQRKKAFEVQSVMGRDLGPTEVDDMIAQLNTWISQSESLGKQLEKKSEYANRRVEFKKKETGQLAKDKNDVVEAVKAELASGDPEVLASLMGMGSGRSGGGGGGRDRGGDGPEDDRRGGRDRRGKRGGGFGGIKKMLTGQH